MQIQRVQNNYNQTFSAKVKIIDQENLMTKGIKRTFTKMCQKLGRNTDEICLSVGKSNNKTGKLEKDVFDVEIRKDFLDDPYCIDYETMQPFFTRKRFLDCKVADEELPVWTSREYSMPRNLTKMYKDYILPVFEKDYLEVDRQSEKLERKLLETAKLKN